MHKKSGFKIHHLFTYNISRSNIDSVREMRHRMWRPVRLHGGAGTVDGRQVEAAADYQGMSAGARVQIRERVAQRLHGRGCEGRALADVEVRKPFLLVPALHGCPNIVLVLHPALCQRVHCPVCNVLAEVQPERPQVEAVVCQCNDALVCGNVSQSGRKK